MERRMSEDRTRVEIGFDSGLIVIATISAKEWEKLQQGLEAGSGIVRFDGEDMAGYHVDVSKVSYVKHEQHSGRVGF
jgi:hypothetical protein